MWRILLYVNIKNGNNLVENVVVLPYVFIRLTNVCVLINWLNIVGSECDWYYCLILLTLILLVYTPNPGTIYNLILNILQMIIKVWDFLTHFASNQWQLASLCVQAYFSIYDCGLLGLVYCEDQIMNWSYLTVIFSILTLD